MTPPPPRGTGEGTTYKIMRGEGEWLVPQSSLRISEINAGDSEGILGNTFKDNLLHRLLVAEKLKLPSVWLDIMHGKTLDTQAAIPKCIFDGTLQRIHLPRARGSAY